MVPTTWIEAKRFCGSPSSGAERAASARAPASSRSDSTRCEVSSAALSAQLLELGPVARELPALRVDHVGRGLGRRSSLASLRLARFDLEREASRAARSEPRTASGVDPSVSRSSTPGHTARDRRAAVLRELDSRARLADQLLWLGAIGAGRPAPACTGTLGHESRQRTQPRASARSPASISSSAATRRRSALDRLRGTGAPARASASARADSDADLLGDERHHRVQRAPAPRSSAQSSVARRSLLAVVEARLDDLQVPVAELRPEEVSRPPGRRGRSRRPRASRVTERDRARQPRERSSGPRRRLAWRLARPRADVRAGSAAMRSRACWRGRAPC